MPSIEISWMRCVNCISKLALISILVVQGCDGRSGGGGGTNPPPGNPPVQNPPADFTISGKVTYERVFFDAGGVGLDYSTRQNLPARGIRVDLVDAQGNIFSTVQSDAQGNYSFTLDADQAGDYRVLANARLAVADIRVTDNTSGNSLYQLQGGLLPSGTQSSVRNLNASIGWGTEAFLTDRAAAPFAILDTVYQGIQRLEAGTGGAFSGTSLPDTELRWSVNNRPTPGERTQEDLVNGDIGSSFYSSGLGVIYLLGAANNDTEEFDQHVIMHEWIHYLQNALSRSDSMGGNHSFSNRLDLRLAFAEGMATGLAAILLDDPLYRDSSGNNQGDEFFSRWNLFPVPLWVGIQSPPCRG